jgi:hypothetical protein
VVEFFHIIFFVNPINHWWNGVAAILIIKENILNISKRFKGDFDKFVMQLEKISIAEATDWMMKYFILLSVFIFFSVEKLFIIQQKANVFISSIIQIETQEFIKKHIIDETNNTADIIGTEDILFLFKLQI